MENIYNVDNLIKSALKASKKDELKAYRNFKAELLKYKTSGANKEITQAVQIQILRSMVKNLKKSEEAYLEANRQDLVDECVVEREVLENLLPSTPGPEMVKLQLVSLAGVNFDPITGKIEIPKKNMGSVIKNLKIALPTLDGKEAADLVKQYLI